MVGPHVRSSPTVPMLAKTFSSKSQSHPTVHGPIHLRSPRYGFGSPVYISLLRSCNLLVPQGSKDIGRTLKPSISPSTPFQVPCGDTSSLDWSATHDQPFAAHVTMEHHQGLGHAPSPRARTHLRLQSRANDVAPTPLVAIPSPTTPLPLPTLSL